MNKFLLTICLVGTTSLLSHAITITVNDPSFELNPGISGDGDSSDNLTPWQERDGVNSFTTAVERVAGFAANGVNHVRIDHGVYIFQDTGVALAPNTTYTLTIAAGHSTTAFAPTDPTTNSSVFALLAGTTNLGGLTGYLDTTEVIADTTLTLASSSINAAGIAADTFLDAPALVFTTGAVVPSENLVILLGDDSQGGASYFDNIRLESSPVPEVSTSLFSVLAGALALLRRRR